MGSITNTARIHRIRTTAAIALSLSAAAVTRATDIHVIATTDTPVPGVPGNTFSSFTLPSINSSGRAAFTATYPTGTGIFSDAPGTLTTIARTGTTAPGTAATFTSFSSFTGPLISTTGQVAFVGTYTGGAGVYRTTGPTPSPVALSGTPAPGGGTYSTLGTPFPYWAMNNNGAIVFQSAVSNGGNTLFTDASGTLARFAGSGTPVPSNGFTSPTLTDAIIPSINDNGRITFTGASVVRHGVYVADGNPPSPVDKVYLWTDPTGIPGSGFDQPIGFNMPLNNHGRSAFTALDNSSRSGVWYKDAAAPSPTLVAMRNVTYVPGLPTPIWINNLGKPAFNESGQMAFTASWLNPDNTAGSAILTHDGTPTGALQRYISRYDPAPGTDGDTFGFFNFGPEMNEDNVLAFKNVTTGGLQGLWIADVHNHIVNVALQGTPWDHDGLPSTPDRVIQSIDFGSSNNAADGHGTQFLANHLAFTLTFTPDSGGGSGVYVVDTTTLPEPATALLLLPTLAALRRRRNEQPRASLARRRSH